jgi:hypothetical protein
MLTKNGKLTKWLRANVIDLISYDLKYTFPNMHGFFTRSLKHMRKHHTR